MSDYKKDNNMGPDVVHSFDSEENCKCPYCGKTLHIVGWIREYPIGILDSEEIYINMLNNEECTLNGMGKYDIIRKCAKKGLTKLPDSW